MRIILLYKKIAIENKIKFTCMRYTKIVPFLKKAKYYRAYGSIVRFKHLEELEYKRIAVNYPGSDSWYLYRARHEISALDILISLNYFKILFNN